MRGANQKVNILYGPRQGLPHKDTAAQRWRAAGRSAQSVQSAGAQLSANARARLALSDLNEHKEISVGDLTFSLSTHRSGRKIDSILLAGVKVGHVSPTLDDYPKLWFVKMFFTPELPPNVFLGVHGWLPGDETTRSWAGGMVIGRIKEIIENL